MWSDLEAPRGLWCNSGKVVQERCYSPGISILFYYFFKHNLLLLILNF